MIIRGLIVTKRTTIGVIGHDTWINEMLMMQEDKDQPIIGKIVVIIMV